MTMHTPTPWQRSGVRGKALIGGVNTDGHDIGTDGDPIAFVYYSDRTTELHRETLGNAEYIVQAVNSHDALVKALETIRDCFWRDGESYDERIADLKQIARDALTALPQDQRRP